MSLQNYRGKGTDNKGLFLPEESTCPACPKVPKRRKGGDWALDVMTIRVACHFKELATRNPQGGRLQDTVWEISRYNALWVLPAQRVARNDIF